MKSRLAEILPEKAEEVKQLKKEHGKTVSIRIISRMECSGNEIAGFTQILKPVVNFISFLNR